MDKKIKIVVILVALLLSSLFLLLFRPGREISLQPQGSRKEIKLPEPSYSGKMSVEEAIFKRRSTRTYKPGPLTMGEVSQLLWAGGGITIDGVTGATRAYPSAGACNPLEFYLVVSNVKGLSPGLYHYQIQEHKLLLLKEGDLGSELTRAALGQSMVEEAAVNIVVTAIYRRTTSWYGERGYRYVHMDLGHAGQNIHLQAEALGLGTVVIGAFNDSAVKKVLGVRDQEPLYIMPVGRK